GIAVKGVDDEERPLVVRRHVGAVALDGEDDTEIGEIADRDIDAVIVERGNGGGGAGDAGLREQARHRYALEIDDALVPLRRGLDRDEAELFEIVAAEG